MVMRMRNGAEISVRASGAIEYRDASGRVYRLDPQGRDYRASVEMVRRMAMRYGTRDVSYTAS